MLLKGHYLDGVIAKFLYAGKDVLTEFLEGAHLFFLSSHADMALIDEGMGTLSGVAVLPLIGLLRIPDLCAENLGHGVLDYAGDV